MVYCKNCGAQMDDNAAYCPKCGTEQRAPNPYQNTRQRPPVDPNDSDSIGWAILGFLVPLVGLILFLVWSSTRPKSAKMAGLGALVNVIFSVVFTIVLFIIYFAFAASITTTSSLF
jgi:uncharacterized membrane protein YvbJ